MHVSISVDPEADDPAVVGLQIARVFGFDTIEDFAAAAAEVEEEEPEEEAIELPTSYPAGWNKAKMRRYMRAMRNTAAKATAVIAANAPAVEASVVQEAVGMSGPEYAGSMASAGFAARNTRGVTDKPWEKRGSTYTIDPTLAKLVLEVADELGIEY
ncbi:hypothetical protein [Jatrophihabitans sp.]|uniref:hypothetical protein n=1 Tax=Jatrophihabitans sp. TaxID=1932789 RepID=UPI002D06AA92|nr:hypothetical protein [Jatrophihabitans sp.]